MTAGWPPTTGPAGSGWTRRAGSGERRGPGRRADRVAGGGRRRRRDRRGGRGGRAVHRPPGPVPRPGCARGRHRPGVRARPPDTVVAAAKRHGKAAGLLVNDGAGGGRPPAAGLLVRRDRLGLHPAGRRGPHRVCIGPALRTRPTLQPPGALISPSTAPRKKTSSWLDASLTRTAITEIGVGLISVGWMGKLHTRAYQAIPLVYPELRIRPRLVHAADTAADRAEYARDVLGYAKGSTDYRDVLADPEVDIVSICAPEPAAQGDRRRRRPGRQAVLDREAGRPGRRRHRRGRRGRAGRRGGHLDRLQLPQCSRRRAGPRS